MERRLSNGFTVVIDDEKFDDYELFEKLQMIDKDRNNIGLVVDVFIEILGNEQYGALKEHVRDEKGKVTMKAMGDALNEIFETNDEIKNS